MLAASSVRSQGVAQHQGRTEDGADGVGYALSGDVGRCAVDRLIEALGPPVLPGEPPTGWPRAERPIDAASTEASSVKMSPKVFSDTITSKLAGRWTNCMAQASTSTCSICTLGYSGERRVATCRQSREDSRTLALSTDANLPRRPWAKLEPDPEDAFYLGLGVAQGVYGSPALGGLVAFLGLGVVQAAGKLPDHHHIHALKDFGLQDAGVGQQRIDLHRAYVGKYSRGQTSTPEAHPPVAWRPWGRPTWARRRLRRGPSRCARPDPAPRGAVASRSGRWRCRRRPRIPAGTCARTPGPQPPAPDALLRDLRSDAVPAKDGNVKLHWKPPFPSPPPPRFRLRVYPLPTPISVWWPVRVYQNNARTAARISASLASVRWPT